MRRLSWTCAALVAVLGLSAARASPARAVTARQVHTAITKMQAWLYSQQNPDGSWSTGKFTGGTHTHGQTGGETAIVTYALLASGQSAQDPRIQQALRYLRHVKMNGTYAVSLRCHVWSHLPDRYLPDLRRDAHWLVQAQKNSLYDYGTRVGKRYDHSCTQYGMLGLWEYAKRGGANVPPAFWRQLADHFVAAQNDDGGWSYEPRNPLFTKSKQSMTAAGLTCLYVVQQELYRQYHKPPAQITASLRGGLNWLDKHFDPEDSLYSLYGIERVGLASGVKTFAGTDWFAQGAAHILHKARRGHMTERGSPYVGTAFALLFLARGRVPVWITKLRVPDAHWNDRPNDIYFLTRYLSDHREREINWQVASLDDDPRQWLNAPVAWLSSDQAVKLTAQQRRHLKTFIDLGGLLVANSENSAAFTRSIRKLAAKLYPRYPIKPLPTDHLLYRMLYTTTGHGRAAFEGVSNHARDLILLSKHDLGMTLQSETHLGRSPIGKLATNLYALYTARGTLRDRLDYPRLTRTNRSQNGDIPILRAEYDGDWNLESKSWTPFENLFFDRTGENVKHGSVRLDHLGTARAPLVHLAGVEPVRLTEAQKQAVKQYVRHGGTILVETIGGRGDFASRIETQLRPLFGRAADPLSSFQPLLSGRGLHKGYRIDHVLYRPYSVVNLSFKQRPRLTAIALHGRPAILFSDEDLSLGALGVKRWGLNGYAPESARQLLTNLLLTAQSHNR